MIFTVNENEEIVTIPYIDLAIVQYVIDNVLEYYKYGNELVAAYLDSINKVVFELHRYATNEYGYHVGTEQCLISYPVYSRESLGLYTNKLKAEEDVAHIYVVRLDDESFELNNPDESPDYYPADEEFWASEFSHYAQTIKQLICDTKWVFADGKWFIQYKEAERSE